MGNILMVIIGLISGLVLIFGISTLVFWGLGNLIIYVFSINYTWTILHGFVCALVYSVIQGIFKSSK